MDINILIQNYGLFGTIGLLLLGLLYEALRNKWFQKLAGYIAEKFIEKAMKNKTKDMSIQIKMIDDSDISNHDIFNYIDFWMYSKVPTIQFSTEYRTVVFRKYLSIFLKSYKTKIYNFVNVREYQTMDNAKVWKALLDLVNSIVYDYEKEMSDAGITKIVIEKMKVKNNDTLSLAIDLIEGICNSHFYDSDKNFLKVYSILNILLSLLENVITNSEAVCNSINGQLKGLKFEGKIEP